MGHLAIPETSISIFATSSIVDRKAAICLLDDDVVSVQGVRRGLDLVAVHVTDDEGSNLLASLLGER